MKDNSCMGDLEKSYILQATFDPFIHIQMTSSSDNSTNG